MAETKRDRPLVRGMPVEEGMLMMASMVEAFADGMTFWSWIRTVTDEQVNAVLAAAERDDPEDLTLKELTGLAFYAEFFHRRDPKMTLSAQRWDGLTNGVLAAFRMEGLRRWCGLHYEVGRDGWDVTKVSMKVKPTEKWCDSTEEILKANPHLGRGFVQNIRDIVRRR